MEIKTFVANYREAFGETAELPIVFWYSDTPESQTEKINGCFFKNMKKGKRRTYYQLKCRCHRMWWWKVLYRFYRYAGTCADFCFPEREVQTDTGNGNRVY